MKALRVSENTHARVVNRRTVELSSVDKVLVDMLDRDEGMQSMSIESAGAMGTKHQEMQWEDLSEAEQSKVPLECRPNKET